MPVTIAHIDSTGFRLVIDLGAVGLLMLPLIATALAAHASTWVRLAVLVAATGIGLGYLQWGAHNATTHTIALSVCAIAWIVFLAKAIMPQRSAQRH